METIELLQKNQESFTVPELRKMLGIGKTEAYWLIKHKDILTVRINGRMRIIHSSFDEWYKNQVRYRIIDGPEPGEKLREVSYSPQEIAAMLSVSEDRIYRLIADGQLETFKADSWMRVPRESFERWYSGQNKYLKPEDRTELNELLSNTYSLPEIRRMLGIHRNTVYEIVSRESGKGIFEVIIVNNHKRITKESFERWYASQNRYHIIGDEEQSEISVDESITEAAQEDISADTKDADVQLPDKPFYRVEELMAALKVSRKVVYRLIQTGEIIALKVGMNFMIPASEFRRYMEGNLNHGVDHSEG